MTKSTLYIISAASGAGKTSLVNAVLEQVDDLTVSVSHTTRSPRDGEIDGENYHFVDKPTFETMVEDNAFFESATVFGNMYGTSRQHIQEQLLKGMDVILEIDWQGARQIRQLMPDCKSIYIVPPSTTALRKRLDARGQDDESIINQRMHEAISEMSHYVEFDYLIINDDFDEAKDNLSAIIKGNRMLHQQQQEKHAELLAQLLTI
ncbi:Guanylate kinase [hydrothermal vent metagenome]|uniref:guanylate kinase n=1 Tax=hydrothermal vent metagenome TaxID=652676 RepID=A0A3B0WSZ7_9ZZZZ